MGNSNHKGRKRASSQIIKNNTSAMTTTQPASATTTTTNTTSRSMSASNLLEHSVNQHNLNHHNLTSGSPLPFVRNIQNVFPLSTNLTSQTTTTNTAGITSTATNQATNATNQPPQQQHQQHQHQSQPQKTRTGKIIIPYERWIRNDCKKWGHFKDFDFYNLILSSALSTSVSHNNLAASSSSNHTHNSNIIIAINNNNNNHNNNNNQHSNEDNNNQTMIISEPTTNFTILSSPSSSSSSVDPTIKNISAVGPLHYVNGTFFKPIERLGDSQFILSQWPLSDVIVTVPCNIERYRPNDKTARETALKLNRVIGVCEQFLVFQIWKGNNEVEIFIYEYDSSKRSSTNTNNNNTNTTNNNNTSGAITTTTAATILSQMSETTNRIVRKLNRRFNSRTYTCLISPDKQFLLITPDYEFNYSYSHHTQSHQESTIILNLNTFALLHVIPARCDQRFAFDPRYGQPNHSAPRFAEFDNVRGQIYDLALEKVIVCSNHTLKTKVFRVEYTRDGYLLIVICTLPVFQRRGRRNYFIYILNSSTLLHMRSVIDYRGPQLTSQPPASRPHNINLLFNMYPSLSNCASSIAVLKNFEHSLQLRVIELYTLPNVRSMTLKELCRRCILRHCDSKHLNRLPLPPKMISYLSFNSAFNSGGSGSSSSAALAAAKNVSTASFKSYLSSTNNTLKTSAGGATSINLSLSNMRRTFSNRCSDLSSRITHNKRSVSNFFAQIKRNNSNNNNNSNSINNNNNS